MQQAKTPAFFGYLSVPTLLQIKGLSMLVERLRDQIKRAERRYRDHADQRKERAQELRKIDAGEIEDVNFNVLENARRLVRRIAFSAPTREGLTSPAALGRETASPTTQSRLLEGILKRTTSSTPRF